MSGLQEHLSTGVTTVCRCWEISRKDGVRLGFTDHDEAVMFDGLLYQASSGLTASAMVQGAGLAVDNAEATGALDSEFLREEDFARGAFDGAEVTVSMVNWSNPFQREVLFRGYVGEIARQDGSFRVELRSLVDRLNQPRGRVFQKPCSAVLGDARCQVDLSLYANSADAEVVALVGNSSIRVRVDGGYAEGWFERGKLSMPDGGFMSIKRDQVVGDERVLTFWKSVPDGVVVGDVQRVFAGCDRNVVTCREKFGNIHNFQGFPDIPGDDWLMAVPSGGQIHDGGSRR